MEHKRSLILLATFLIVATTLACGIFGGRDESTGMPGPTVQSNNVGPIDEPVEQQPLDEPASDDNSVEQSESSHLPDFDLGDEYRSEEGGYIFKPIPDYEFEEFFGLATMVAPDAKEDLGPILMLIGGLNEEEITSDEIINDFIKDAESEDVEILDRREVSVDGISGLLANFAGDIDGQHIIGRIVVVAVSPTQQFTMFASTPRDRWGEIESSFDAVLDSVQFFEPREINLTREQEEIESDEGPSNDAPILDFSSLEEFPTEANQLLPGSFAYLIASDQGFPTIVGQGSIQNQSTSVEYIISLVSEDQNNILTLLIPFAVSPGSVPMNPYNPSSISNSPGATVNIGFTRYTNTDGIIVIDKIADDTLTGSVFFTAVDDDDNEIAVSGFFNELPLSP